MCYDRSMTKRKGYRVGWHEKGVGARVRTFTDIDKAIAFRDQMKRDPEKKVVTQPRNLDNAKRKGK